MFPTGASAGLDEVLLRVKFPARVSASPIVKAIAAVGVSSVVTRLLIVEMVGAALAESLTRTKKLRLTELLVVCPSFIVTVIRAVPETPLTCRQERLPVVAGGV